MSKSARVEIAALSDKGEGIAMADGLEIYIDNALPGEKGVVTYDKPFVQGSKRYGALSFDLTDPSPDRAVPFCPYFFKCGGCTLQHLKPQAALQLKQQALIEALSSCTTTLPEVKVTGFEHLPCRFKSTRAFLQTQKGVRCGFYQSRSHEVLDIAGCPLEPSWFGPFLSSLCDLLTAHQVSVYDEQSFEGNLRHVMLRDGGATGSRLAVLVGAQPLQGEVKEALKDLAGRDKVNFYYCLNQDRGNRILTEQIEPLHEEGAFAVSFLNKIYQASPLSFVQVDYQAASYLYQRAAGFCAQVKNLYPQEDGANAEDCALDLCCGMGTMTLILSDSFSQVYGVEIVKEAVAMARENARLNDCANVSFIAAPLEGALEIFQRRNIRAVICDPSRAGLGKRTVKALCRLKGPVHLSLIFCSLKALKRDLPPLLDAGYAIQEAEAVDMFRYSNHLEALVLLSKRA